jgi:hypothetical protein
LGKLPEKYWNFSAQILAFLKGGGGGSYSRDDKELFFALAVKF